MDFTQAQLLLDKAKSLVNNMAADPTSVAQIEKDLLKNYLRQLYELIDQPQTAATSAAPRPTTSPAPKPKRKAYKPPRIVEVPDTIKQLEEEVVPPTPTPTPTPPPPKPAPPKPTPAAAPTQSAAVPAKFSGLFSIPVAKELSEKLSATPLKNLKKGMSINDKLLYQSALFANDNGAFLGALDVLNDLAGMDAAKQKLVEYAEANDWLEEERMPVAQAFVKHVSRRYL